MIFLSVWASVYSILRDHSVFLNDESIEGYLKCFVANPNPRSRWDTYFICTFLSFVLVRVCWKPCDSCCRYVSKDFPKGLQKRTVDSWPFHCVIFHWSNNVNWGKRFFIQHLQTKGNVCLIRVTDKARECLP